MDFNGRVHPECNYASNPYHECAVSCLERIAQGKGRKGKNKSGKDKSQSVKEEKISQSKDGKRRLYPSCTRAPNPFHECDESCLIKIAEAKIKGGKTETGLKFSNLSESFRKKKSEPKSREEPRQSSEKVAIASKTYPAKVLPSPPVSQFAAQKKVESEIVEYHSSSDEENSDYLRRRNDTLNHKSDQTYSKKNVESEIMEVVPSPLEHSKKSSKNVKPDHHKDSLKQEKDSSLEIPDNYLGFSFSGMNDSFEDSLEDEEEAKSVVSDCVSVGKYQVRASVASILQSVLEKYGDIASSCQLESVSMRAYYLECLCFVIQELQSTPFNNITKSKVKEMLAILSDVEFVKIEVTWIRSILNDLLEAVEFKSQYGAIEAAKENCIRALETTSKELESKEEDLARKEKEVELAKTSVVETREKLEELELERTQLNKTILFIKAKMDKYNGKCIMKEGL